MLTRDAINLNAIGGEIRAAPARFYDADRRPFPEWETFCKALGEELTAELAAIAAACPLFHAHTLILKPPRGPLDTCRECGASIVTTGPRFCSNRCEQEWKRLYARVWARENPPVSG